MVVASYAEWVVEVVDQVDCRWIVQGQAGCRVQVIRFSYLILCTLYFMQSVLRTNHEHIMFICIPPEKLLRARDVLLVVLLSLVFNL